MQDLFYHGLGLALCTTVLSVCLVVAEIIKETVHYRPISYYFVGKSKYVQGVGFSTFVLGLSFLSFGWLPDIAGWFGFGTSALLVWTMVSRWNMSWDDESSVTRHELVAASMGICAIITMLLVSYSISSFMGITLALAVPALAALVFLMRGTGLDVLPLVEKISVALAILWMYGYSAILIFQ